MEGMATCCPIAKKLGTRPTRVAEVATVSLPFPEASVTAQSRREGARVGKHRVPEATVPTAVPPRGVAHRAPEPLSARKGRIALFAVAAGAVAAAGQSWHSPTSSGSAQAQAVTLASDQVAITDVVPAQVPADDASRAPSVLATTSVNSLAQYGNLLAKGQRYNADRDAREAATRRPLFVLPAIGVFTSGFGGRWGALHAGVDIAAPIGTPISAAADGTVIDAGPASGFGMWVRIQHVDGTVTVYGHVNEALVSVGQQVMAGDEIATVGNRGFSTGPHLHFEVHLPGDQKIDPLPWLASRGISLGPQGD